MRTRMKLLIGKMSVRRMKAAGLMVMTLVLVCLYVGCSKTKSAGGAAKTMEYTVVQMGELPAEVTEMIENQGDKVFRMVYKSEGWMYVMRGYGRQELGGYSIRITNVHVADETLHVESQLIGPGKQEAKEGRGSNPYFVIKLEDPGYPVTFDDAGAEE